MNEHLEFSVDGRSDGGGGGKTSLIYDKWLLEGRWLSKLKCFLMECNVDNIKGLWSAKSF